MKAQMKKEWGEKSEERKIDETNQRNQSKKERPEGRSFELRMRESLFGFRWHISAFCGNAGEIGLALGINIAVNELDHSH
jgi:hypothetical protein